MGYWQTRRDGIETDVTIEHDLVELLAKALKRVKPGLYDTLYDSGELEAYLVVKVHDALEEVAMLKDTGMDEAAARAEAMESMLPQVDGDAPEQYELEGHAADEFAALTEDRTD